MRQRKVMRLEDGVLAASLYAHLLGLLVYHTLLSKETLLFGNLRNLGGLFCLTSDSAALGVAILRTGSSSGLAVQVKMIG